MCARHFKVVRIYKEVAMLAFRHGRFTVRHSSAFCSALLSGVCALVFASSVGADWVGLLSDNGNDQIRVFDADTDSVRLNIEATPGSVTGDCAVSSDQRLGLSTNSAGVVSFFDLADDRSGDSQGSSDVRISNLGVDMALSPDNAFLVTAGGGALNQPLSVVSLADRSEVSTSGPFADHTSVEFCDNGTLLVTTSHGEYYGAGNGSLHAASLDSVGQISLSGAQISSGAQPNNSACAPGSMAGVLLDRNGGLTSFTLPGLLPADQEFTQVPEVVSAGFSSDGRRLFVRTATTVEAFEFNPLTGEMSPDWKRVAPRSSPYYGMDQVAVHPSGDKVYVDGGDVLLILDEASGETSGVISAGDATGVCFARAPRDATDLLAGGDDQRALAAPPP
jgi:hypothetical protein